MTTLTWLHLSDLHASHPRTGWDAARVEETLVEDLHRLRGKGLEPDLIFFTGDAAFGQIGHEPEETLRGQLDRFATFLDQVRCAVDPAFPWENVFSVPGNHDVNRNLVDEAQTERLDNRGGALRGRGADPEEERQRGLAVPDGAPGCGPVRADRGRCIGPGLHPVANMR